MTAVLLHRRTGWFLAFAGCAVLLARPSLLPDGGDPTTRLVALFVVLGLVGALWPTPRAGTPAPARVAVGALALGSAAFVVGRASTGGFAAAHPWFVRSVVLNALAAVAEEAFFRRLVFDLLSTGARRRAGVEPAVVQKTAAGTDSCTNVGSSDGDTVAIVGSALLFALVHVTVWGWAVLPLDLAAGLLLSWQRSVSGRWSVPAATHVLANALALL